ncbi:DUF2147 domain-containing protein [Aureimonas sp. ME7]|uniref:DUF2147 domain-containing protein n=1 Tax=Aureimonas sp. ME7 TaxID=2744252 RepID=UPI0015F3E28B|nr:DUF2147 domain-containing protein [Aureimonas sp. ME7]
MPRLLQAAAVAIALGAPAAAAEPILGVWRLSNGETVSYRACPQGFCSKVNSGKYAGKTVGIMQGSGQRYTGSVIDPSNDKQYEGRVEIEGNQLTLTGCVAKVFCRSQTWTRTGASG